MFPRQSSQLLRPACRTYRKLSRGSAQTSPGNHCRGGCASFGEELFANAATRREYHAEQRRPHFAEPAAFKLSRGRLIGAKQSPGSHAGSLPAQNRKVSII